MAKNNPSRDDALEALDFIVNVLKEHEKDLDRLITELGGVTKKIGNTSKVDGKIENIEGRLSTLQTEIAKLISYLSISGETKPISEKSVVSSVEEQVTERLLQRTVSSPPVILRCKKWEDFLTLAYQAETLSFLNREAENTFQADALKNNQIITFNGEIPNAVSLLKVWLSKKLNIPEKKILEGILSIG